MNIVYEYSHLGGRQILQTDHQEILDEIHSVIRSVKQLSKTKRSREKTMRGRMLYSPIEINSHFREAFRRFGFNELRDYFDIVIPQYSVRINRAYKQVDFVKDNILVEVQFGKYAFMFYDLAKFQYFFNENKAKVGVEIVPCHNLHKHMSTGVSYGEQLVFDVERLKKHFPAVPIYIILIDF